MTLLLGLQQTGWSVTSNMEHTRSGPNLPQANGRSRCYSDLVFFILSDQVSSKLMNRTCVIGEPGITTSLAPQYITWLPVVIKPTNRRLLTFLSLAEAKSLITFWSSGPCFWLVLLTLSRRYNRTPCIFDSSHHGALRSSCVWVSLSEVVRNF